jgi:hypothetical protein
LRPHIGLPYALPAFAVAALLCASSRHPRPLSPCSVHQDHDELESIQGRCRKGLTTRAFLDWQLTRKAWVEAARPEGDTKTHSIRGHVLRPILSRKVQDPDTSFPPRAAPYLRATAPWPNAARGHSSHYLCDTMQVLPRVVK